MRSRAVTMGDIADILASRGDLDGALRIRQEEELPVYDRLGDVRSRAITLGKISDILEAWGDFDGALCLRKEQQLPIFDQLGDVRSRAVTMGNIADIHQSRGNLDEALRIRQEEELPVYVRLGDTDGMMAVKLKTARIAIARGIADQVTFDIVLEDLSQAYSLAKQLTRLDAICATADGLGMLLALAGAHEPARVLLAEALDGYRKLGAAQHAARAEAWLAELPPPGEG